jgi:hypothetical protein
MKCPICDELIAGYWITEGCTHCRVYMHTLTLARVGGELLQGIEYRLGVAKRFKPDGRTVPESYWSAAAELRQVVKHSEWYKWVETITNVVWNRNRPEIPFQLSLFADWCADNGFPLQEQAVRQRLQEAEGR